MTKAPKLSDLHYVLLATAANRATGSLLPTITSVIAERATITRAIRMLIKRGLAKEVEATSANTVWRKESERKLAAVITDAGRAAINVDDGKARDVDTEPASHLDVQMAEAAVPVTEESGSAGGSKRSLLVAMLKRDGGATLVELAQATAWLSHTTRAALSGLRKKGHAVIREQIDGVSRYFITAER